MVAIFIRPTKNVYTCTVLECGPIEDMRGLIPFMAQVAVHLRNGQSYLAFAEKNVKMTDPLHTLILIGQNKCFAHRLKKPLKIIQANVSKFSVRLFFFPFFSCLRLFCHFCYGAFGHVTIDT